MSFTGGCRCGACRYVLDFPALPASYACHCLDCQTMTGSAFSLHATLPVSRFALEGSTEGWSRINGEGTRSTHHVCATCRSRIHSTNEGRPDLVILRTGTLDASDDVVPVVHMWTRSKQRWIALPENSESYAEAIPPERLKALFTLNPS